MKNLVIHLLVGIVLLSSCSDHFEATELLNEEVISARSDGDRFSNRKKIGKALSIISNNSAVSSKLIEFCEEEKYGDLEFYLIEKLDQVVSGNGKTLEELLVATNPRVIQPILDELCENDKGLSVLYVEDFNMSFVGDSSFEIYISENGGEEEFNVTYFENGVMDIWSDASVEPGEEGFVLRTTESYVESERYDQTDLDAMVANNNIFYLPSPCGTGIYSKLHPDHQHGAGVTGGGYTGGGYVPGGGNVSGVRDCDEDCDRDCNEGKEYFIGMKMDELHESFLQGRPDIWFGVVWGTVTSGNNPLVNSVHKRFEYKRGNKGHWSVIKFPIVVWDRSLVGEFMKYTFLEEDPGDLFSLTVGVSIPSGPPPAPPVASLSVSFQVSNDNDDLGSEVIYYCEDIEDKTLHPHQDIWFGVDEL